MESNNIIGTSTVDVQIRTGVISAVPVSFKTAVLKPNLINGVPVLTQEMFDEFGSNTKFVVRYDYTVRESTENFNVTIDSSGVLVKNSVPYYYGGGAVHIPIGKTLTLLNTQSCVLLNQNHTDLLNINIVTANENPIDIYIASKVQGTYLDAYKIETPVVIPENCILEFDGGSISNGALAGQNTRVINLYDYQIMKDVSITGTFRGVTNILEVESYNESLIK